MGPEKQTVALVVLLPGAPHWPPRGGNWTREEVTDEQWWSPSGFEASDGGG